MNNLLEKYKKFYKEYQNQKDILDCNQMNYYLIVCLVKQVNK